MGFDYTLDWGKSEPQRLLNLIREIGIHRLAAFDGCLCGSFEIRNVEIDISCGKGRDRGIWISSRSLAYPPSEGDLKQILYEVGKEVQRQIIALNDGRGPITVHYRQWCKQNEKDNA